MIRKPYFNVAGGKETCGLRAWWMKRADPWREHGKGGWANGIRCLTKAHALRQFAKLRRGRAQIDVRGRLPRGQKAYVWRWK
jgi:hypothetical protein